MEIITSWIIPGALTIGLGYVVYQQYLEQERKHKQKLADKAAETEAQA